MTPMGKDVTDEERVDFKARWLKRYGKPWDCPEVQAIASLDAYRRARLWFASG